MPLATTLSVDFIAIFILCCVSYLVKGSIILSARKRRQYGITIGITFIIVLMEIGSISAVYYFPTLRCLQIVTNILGFSLSPVIPMLLAFIYDDELKEKHMKLLLPMLLYGIICIASAWTGWIFTVTSSNEYFRGPLFFLNIIVALYGFLFFIYTNYKSARNYDLEERVYLSIICLLVVIGNIIQIIFPSILLIWNCVAVSLLLYYVFLQELEFKYDSLTGAFNRTCFEKKLKKLENSSIVIIIFDLNNLKKINDTCGHIQGDKVLKDAVKMIKKSFYGIGSLYRIGGDEFCVLCKETDRKNLDQILGNMDKRLIEKNRNTDAPISLAHGYAIYEGNNGQDVQEVIKLADEKMYTHKKYLKEYETDGTQD